MPAILQPATLQFISALAANNNKPWFDEHRMAYATAKENHLQLVEAVRLSLLPIEPLLATQQAKDSVFRIFRDVRFSKDKTPYKNHFGASFSRGGRKYPGAGYYLHLEPGKSFIAAGIWMPEPRLLKALRQEIDYHLPGLEAILQGKAFKKLFPKIEGDTTTRPPQGYAADHPGIHLLRQKSFIVSHPLPDATLTSAAAIKTIAAACATAAPFVAFLNQAVVEE